MSNIALKIIENRLRNVAKRRRLTLIKSRRRDPMAFDFGTYTLVDRYGRALASDVLHLADVERYLAEARAE